MDDLDFVWGITALVFCVVALMANVGLFRRIMADRARKRFFENHGEWAEGTVMRISDTGRTADHRQIVEFVVEVRREGHDSYRATTEKALSPRHDAGRYHIGTTVRLLVDPADPEHVSIVDVVPDPNADYWRR